MAETRERKLTNDRTGLQQQVKKTRILSYEQKLMRKARGRQRITMATEEERELRKAYHKRRYDMMTEEERAKKNARKRELRLKWTDEQRERNKVYRDRHRAKLKSEHREGRRKAYDKRHQAKLTDEQREQSKIYQRQRRAMIPDEQREKLRARANAIRKVTDEQRERKRAYNKIYKARQKELRSLSTAKECPEKFAPAKVKDGCDFKTVHFKSGGITDEQCETGNRTEVDKCRSLIGELDYFEECEEWRAHVKMENNIEEQIE